MNELIRVEKSMVGNEQIQTVNAWQFESVQVHYFEDSFLELCRRVEK